MFVAPEDKNILVLVFSGVVLGLALVEDVLELSVADEVRCSAEDDVEGLAEVVLLLTL
jgi:hypothetical protein